VRLELLGPEDLAWCEVAVRDEPAELLEQAGVQAGGS
jgi:hypothetical protein